MGLDFEAESRWPRKKEKEEEVPNRGNKIGRGNRVSGDRGGRARLTPWASRHWPVPTSHSPFHPKPTFGLLSVSFVPDFSFIPCPVHGEPWLSTTTARLQL